MTVLDTVSTRPTDALAPASLVPPGLRLQLRDDEIAGRFVDGGWWPHSRDLGVELPSLIAAVTAAGYEVSRVSYRTSGWDPAPRAVVIAGHRVKLGGYRTQSVAMISLVDGSGWKRVDLVVVPPDADAAFAHRALDLAGRAGETQRADAILETARPGS